MDKFTKVTNLKTKLDIILITNKFYITRKLLNSNQF